MRCCFRAQAAHGCPHDDLHAFDLSLSQLSAGSLVVDSLWSHGAASRLKLHLTCVSYRSK